MEQISPELLNERDAARFLGLSPATLMKQRSTGALEGHLPLVPFVRLGQRCIRYRLSDLITYVEQNRVSMDRSEVV